MSVLTCGLLFAGAVNLAGWLVTGWQWNLFMLGLVAGVTLVTALPVRHRA